MPRSSRSARVVHVATRLILPARLGSVFTVHSAEREGASRGRLDRHPEVRAPFPGVRIRVHPPPPDEPPWETRRRTVLQLAAAYRHVMPKTAFFSHATAAEIYGAPLPLPGSVLRYDLWRADADMCGLIEASTLVPHRSPRADAVTAHQLSPRLCMVIEHNGWRVSDPASTWAMLADRLSVTQLVVLGDGLVRRDRIPGTPIEAAPAALATVGELGAAIRSGPRKGVDKLRRALPLIRQGSSSELETLQRLAMRAEGLPEPQLDYDVRDEFGRLLGCTEIVYAQYKIAIECEGDHHRTSRAQWTRDIQKHQDYMETGWLVVRATGHEIRYAQPEPTRRVRAAPLQRGWRPGP